MKKVGNMKRYELEDGYFPRSVYGESFFDALTSAKDLYQHVRDASSKPTGKYDPIRVVELCGYADTTGSTRGGRPFKRIVVGLDTGKRVAIDATAGEDLSLEPGED